MNQPHPPSSSGFLHKLGLHRPELRAWAMYDWANSAFVTVIMTAVFPIFFASVAGAGLPEGVATLRYGVATTVGLLVIALLAPVLGAMADFAPVKKRMLASFMGIGVVAVGLMFFIHQGDWLLASILFVVANIGANGSFVFYDALLPHVAADEEMDRVSTAGYALGYVGGGLILVAVLAAVLHPGAFGLPAGEGLTPAQQTLPTRLSFVAVAVWWLAFSIPLFRKVPEPPVAALESGAGRSVRTVIRELSGTFHHLRSYRNAFVMLVAFLIYNDGIGTIIRMATIYGTELGISSEAMIKAIILTQFVGIPFAFLFGSLAGRIGVKPAIYLGLVVYVVISIVGFFMKTEGHFLLLAILVGMVQGGTQALSRSLFASLIPRAQSGQFFGFFAVVEKFAGILGPFVFAATIALTGSSRNAILTVVGFFVLGGWLLKLVRVEEGQQAAREADARET